MEANNTWIAYTKHSQNNATKQQEWGCTKQRLLSQEPGDHSTSSAFTSRTQFQRILTEWSELGADSSVHWLILARQAMNQAQGPFRESSQDQKETKPETGLKTRL